MNIFVSGINHKTTPLDIRERLSFSPDEQKQALLGLGKTEGVKECIILSTCNRTEVYIYTDKADFKNSIVENFLCGLKGINATELRKYFYFYSGVKAVKHLFKVASGLDSLVLGEDQILGQIKNAHNLAMELQSSSVVLNTLFRDAVTASKKVKTHTALSTNQISIGSVAVKLLWDTYDGRMDDKCVLIIGMGKIGELTLKHLVSKGIGKIYVTNRSHGRTSEMEKVYGNVFMVGYTDRYSVMDECDAVISSTSSPHYTITRDMVENSVKTDKTRVFIDLAVPRDIDEEISGLPNTSYYNIDNLKETVERNIDLRLNEASKAEQILSGFTAEFEKWYKFRGVLPVIKDIQKFARNILDEKIDQTISKLRNASDEDKEVVKSSMTSTVNGLLNTLIYSVRDCGSKEDIETYFRCISEVLKNEQQ